MNNEEMIELNNRLRAQLNNDNKRYYEKILTYVRLTLNIEEQKKEEVLLEILQDILEAQQNGRSAEEFFGKDPKAISDALIAELPKESKKEQTTLLLNVFLILLQIDLINNLMEPVVAISLFKTGLPILLLMGGLFFLLRSLKYATFNQKKIETYLFGSLAFLCLIAAVTIPIISDKLNGVGQMYVVPHQLFAFILLLFSSLILLQQSRSGGGFSENFLTVIFILLELSVLLKLIDPVTLSDNSKLLFSVILLLFFLIIPSLPSRLKKTD